MVISNSSVFELNINSQTQNDNNNNLLSLLLSILIPIVVGPLIGFFFWYIRGYYENNRKLLENHLDEKKKYTISHVRSQLEMFYWPMHLHIIRYKQLIERYREFKSGHFSLSSSGQMDFLKPNQITNSNSLNVGTRNDIRIDISDDQNQNIPIEMQLKNQSNSNSQKDIPSHSRSIGKNQPSKSKEDTKSKSTSNSQKDIPISNQLFLADLELDPNLKGEGMGLTNALKIIDKFNLAIEKYETEMVKTLKKIQEIYTQSAPIAEPNPELLLELIKLDGYITYVVTFRELSANSGLNSMLEDKIERAKFPNQVFILIDKQVHYLQSIYNDLVYNHNNSVLKEQYFQNKGVAKINGDTS